MKNVRILLAGLLVGAMMIGGAGTAWARPYVDAEEEAQAEQGGDAEPQAEDEGEGGGTGGGSQATIGGDICNDTSISEELREAAGCQTNQTLVPVVTGIIQVVLGLVGIVAVCVMIYGGFTYLTSTGNPAKIAKAKNILLYGVVGVVVAGLAYAIMFFVSKALGG